MKATLGLRPGIVRIEKYCEDWPRAFEAAREALARALGDEAADIQHIGSTAVPGLPSKPILDIAVGLKRAPDIDSLTAKLRDIGYEFAVDAGSEGGLIYFRTGDGIATTHHVHIVGIDDTQWRNYLHFRNRLRADARLRSQYAALKAQLVAEYAQDRENYTKAKIDFIRSAIRE